MSPMGIQASREENTQEADSYSLPKRYLLIRKGRLHPELMQAVHGRIVLKVPFGADISASPGQESGYEHRESRE